MLKSSKIAIASSGLGHIARGIETWARDTAVALAGAGADVTLFAAGPLDLALPAGARAPAVVVLPCWRRFDARTRAWAARCPGWSWRWGLKDGYGWEQFTFWLRLQRRLRQGRYDILHVQDPLLAAWCRRSRAARLLRTREILAHGTEEPLDFLAAFPFVQHLAPWHLAAARDSLGAARCPPDWIALPNFVDTDVFRPPVDAAAQQAARRRLGLPATGRLIGSVAAVQKHHKRVDYLIREFAALPADPELHLVVAGARQPDTAELVQLAQTLAPGRIHVRCDIPRADMPALYQALDAFVLASLFEMMPIALLEALAAGRPVLVNRHPVLMWMAGIEATAAGGGGLALNLACDGVLTDALARLTPDWLASAGRAARQQAEKMFARSVVVAQYLAYYAQVGVGRGGLS